MRNSDAQPWNFREYRAYMYCIPWVVRRGSPAYCQVGVHPLGWALRA